MERGVSSSVYRSISIEECIKKVREIIHRVDIVNIVEYRGYVTDIFSVYTTRGSVRLLFNKKDSMIEVYYCDIRDGRYSCDSRMYELLCTSIINSILGRYMCREMREGNVYRLVCYKGFTSDLY